MTNELKNIFFTTELSSIFQKHHWCILSNSEKNYHFNYKGEIADYYLIVNYSYNSIKFDYTLDIEFSKDRINDLFLLINFVNQKTQRGHFIYDLAINKVKFITKKQFFLKVKNEIIKNIIEDNLNLTNELLHNFVQATHNLIYAEKFDQNFIELLFLKIEGNA